LLDYDAFVEEVGNESYGTNSIANKSLINMTGDPTNKSLQTATEELDKLNHTIQQLAVKTGPKETIVGIQEEEKPLNQDTIQAMLK
jgi:hypothetical protein